MGIYGLMVRRLVVLGVGVCLLGCASNAVHKKKPVEAAKASQPSPPPVEAAKVLGAYGREGGQLDQRAAELAQDAASRYVTPYNRTVYEKGVALVREKKYSEARRYFDEAIRLAVQRGEKGGEPVQPTTVASVKPELPLAVKQEDYRVCPGDTLEVVVWGVKDLSGEVQIGPDGKMSYPYVGDVRAAGMTFAELATYISEKLAQRAQQQEAPRPKGEYRICPGDTLSVVVEGQPDMGAELQVAPDGLISFQYVGEIKAQGLTFRELSAQMSERVAKYVRNGKVIVNAKRVIGEVPVKAAAFVEPPKVTIQAKLLVGNTVSVMGAVGLPGRYTVTRDSTVTDVLAQAGGVLRQLSKEGVAEGANLRDAYLLRNGKKIPVSFEQLILEGDATQNIPVLPNDLIYIPTTREKQEVAVTILGALRNPGRIRLKDGMRVLDVIAEAGGVFMGSIDQVQLEAGALNLAFLSRDGIILPVDFEKLVTEGDMSQNVLVMENDFIYVPTTEENLIFVLGEVLGPRAVPFGTKMTFSRALASAGGMTLNGTRGAVYLVRGDLKKNPEVRRVDAFAVLEGRAADIPLKPYDIIYVSPTALTETSHIITQIVPGLGATLDVKAIRHWH